VEGHWLWTDAKDSDVAFTNWAEDEPSDTHDGSGEDEDCAYIYGGRYSNAKKRSKWGDKKCSESFAYICVFPPPPKSDESQKPMVPDVNEVEYFWYADPIWGQCSGGCNTATKRRTVKCMGSDGGETRDVSKCRGSKPDDVRDCTPKGCIPQPTPAPPPTPKPAGPANMNSWTVGPWGECAGGCPGLGTKHRNVRCVDRNGKEVSKSSCPQLSRNEPEPVSNEPCMMQGCEAYGTNTGSKGGSNSGNGGGSSSSLVVPFVLVCLALVSVVGYVVHSKVKGNQKYGMYERVDSLLESNPAGTGHL